MLFENIHSGITLYEIRWGKEPYISSWEVKECFHFIGETEHVYLPDKFIGKSSITRQDIGAVFFFSYEAAEKFLNSINKKR